MKIGTRASTLALKQCEQVVQKLQEAYPALEFEICPIQTKGDLQQHIALDQFGGQGVFVKEIEQQLLDGKIDLAVHSMKDMPSQLDDRLCFTKTILREDARDVLILSKVHSLHALPHHARIATGSKRRKQQLLKLRSDIHIVGIRGNIETRLRKMKEEGLDGIILAAAAMHRLGLQEDITQYFSEEEMIPACGQGAIALEVRSDRKDLLTMINALSEEVMDLEVCIERAFLKQLGAGCHTPVGARCHVIENQLHLRAMYGSEDETKITYVTKNRPLDQGEELVEDCVAYLKHKIGENK